MIKRISLDYIDDVYSSLEKCLEFTKAPSLNILVMNGRFTAGQDV